MQNPSIPAFLAATGALAALVAPVYAAAPSENIKPALRLVKRVTPEFAGKVKFSIRKKLSNPTIQAQGEGILIQGSDMSECLRAYGYYLRNIAMVHISWNGNNNTAARLVIPKETIHIPAALPFNYAYNYCTLSYTGVHWDKKRWTKELDRLALDGYRYVLVTAGLETVWQRFLKDLGYPEDKIKAYIANPAYSAWWHMGNLEGEGGPVHPDIIQQEAELGAFIVKRMRQLGMEPVLQGYVGFLPHDFDHSSVSGTILGQGTWCGLYKRPAVLQPTAPDFPKLAALWYKHLHRVYGGKAKVYGGDLFHEGGHAGNTPLKEAAQAVQKAMHQASPKSIWLLQAWGYNPSPVLLSGTDPEYTVILALDKDMSEGHNINRNYQGRRHVWCELLNFGGNHGLYGGAGLLEKMAGNAGGASGIGLISEGLETNPFYYALLAERISNRDVIDRSEFIRKYTLARYGVDSQELQSAFHLLAESVYSPNGLREGCLESILCARPSLDARKASTWANPNPYYSTDKVRQAAKLMLSAGKQHKLSRLETFRYDMADLCRQILADQAREQLPKCKAAFEAKNLNAFQKESAEYLKLITDTAEILATSEHFLLGTFLEGARAKAGKDKEAQAQMERAVRQLISTWAPRNSSLNDYAHRQFSEMMQHYYLLRWKAYFNARIKELGGSADAGETGRSAEEKNDNNGTMVSASYEKSESVDAIQQAFPTANIPLLTTAKGDIMKLAEKLLR